MNTIAFARGIPAPSMIANSDIRAAVDRALEKDASTILSYGTGGGYPPLRRKIAEHHGVSPDQVVVTNGSLQAFQFLAEIVARNYQPTAAAPKPVAIVENPTYDRPLLTLAALGFEIVPVRLDADGVDADELCATINKHAPVLVYLIPNFQNPAGSTLSEERRQAIRTYCASNNTLFFEDDPYGKLFFGDAPPLPLYSAATAHTMVYSSSFSKTISPGLRVGYVVAPETLAAELAKHANNTYISPSFIGEAAVSELWLTPQYFSHLEFLRRELNERCGILCGALDELLPTFSYARPDGGYFLWGKFPGDVDTDELLAAAQLAGVSFVAGSACGENNRSAIRFAFSYPDRDDIRTGIERLAGVLAEATVVSA